MSKLFSSRKTKEQKDELVLTYKNWYNSEITKELIKDLENTLEALRDEEDGKVDFVSMFQSKHSAAFYKGQRKILKKTLKQLNYK